MTNVNHETSSALGGILPLQTQADSHEQFIPAFSRNIDEYIQPEAYKFPEYTEDTLFEVSQEVTSEEVKTSSWKRLTNFALVSAAGGSLLFEQSPGNEALRTSAGLDVLESTRSALAVGATVAAITVAIEFGSSALISVGLHQEGGLVQKLKSKLTKDHEEAESDTDITAEDRKMSKLASVGADTAIALGLGAGLVTIKKHMQDTEPTLAKDLKTSAKATGIVAGVSGLIGYLAGGGIQNADKVGLETPAQYVIDYGTDTRFWGSLLVAGYGAHFMRKGIDKVRQTRKDEPQIAEGDNV